MGQDAQARARHTCNPQRPGQPLPFGRPDPTGKCAGCAERAAERAEGVPARILTWTQAPGRSNGGYPSDTEHRAHFAPGGPHATGECSPVCTFGDW